jgi:hypothetical protein
MRESCKYGSARGASRKGGPYRNRREFIAGLGTAAAWPLVARAQQGERVRRIGGLFPLAEDDPLQQAWVKALDDRLERLGWQIGRNLRVDYRWAAGDADRMRVAAAELVGLAPDLLLAGNAPTAAALQRETRSIPIVFLTAGDPVFIGFVSSFAHPGGNMTGERLPIGREALGIASDSRSCDASGGSDVRSLAIGTIRRGRTARGRESCYFFWS